MLGNTLKLPDHSTGGQQKKLVKGKVTHAYMYRQNLTKTQKQLLTHDLIKPTSSCSNRIITQSTTHVHVAHCVYTCTHSQDM